MSSAAQLNITYNRSVDSILKGKINLSKVKDLVAQWLESKSVGFTPRWGKIERVEVF